MNQSQQMYVNTPDSGWFSLKDDVWLVLSKVCLSEMTEKRQGNSLTEHFAILEPPNLCDGKSYLVISGLKFRIVKTDRI